MTAYFAYGSNMSTAQMARRCRGARVPGPATLIAKRRQGARLGGLWEFPGGKIEDGGVRSSS